ncbi:MAG: hypothetical protein Tsb0021_17890 [Chlamydiales bacterium]
MRKKRRPFLLLEVLIALAIVSLCAIPLIAPNLWLIKAEKEFLQTIENDRIAHLIFLHVVENLYNNVYSWENLKNNEEIPFSLESIPAIPENWPFEVTVRSKVAQSKTGLTDEHSFNLLEITITIKKTPEIKGEKDLIVKNLIFVERNLKKGTQID